ncbi:unnamed protein product [Cuscuta epithymum]|uniref:Uncharacterized protein n=1 Tax=Cuscuta epithymum TaxID=186058 RepID=A0AAV0D1W1_9ASTE|nr:unnamed protein product [Cuscuta epithymum]
MSPFVFPFFQSPPSFLPLPFFPSCLKFLAASFFLDRVFFGGDNKSGIIAHRMAFRPENADRASQISPPVHQISPPVVKSFVTSSLLHQISPPVPSFASSIATVLPCLCSGYGRCSFEGLSKPGPVQYHRSTLFAIRDHPGHCRRGIRRAPLDEVCPSRDTLCRPREGRERKKGKKRKRKKKEEKK